MASMPVSAGLMARLSLLVAGLSLLVAMCEATLPPRDAQLPQRGKRSVSSFFDDRNRPDLTGVIGDTVELPCAIMGRLGKHKVSWIHDDREEILSIDTKIITDDPRFAIRYGRGESTYYLSIRNGVASDAGTYRCQVDTEPMQTKIFHLKMIADSDSRRWRTDARCGPRDMLRGALANTRAECDPHGAYQCCSGSGWCGFTRLHCDCRDCIDYTEIYEQKQTETEHCSAPFRKMADSGQCVSFAEARMTWSAADRYCRDIGAKLLTYNSLDQLIEQTRMILSQAGEEGAKFWVHLSTEGKLLKTRLTWRWILGPAETDQVGGDRCSAVSYRTENVYNHDEHCQDLHLPLCYKDI